MNQIVRLRWLDYEAESSYFFFAPEGTTEESFKELCDSLLIKAAKEAVQLKGYTEDFLQEGNENPFWVGWANIVNVLAYRLLPELGYERIKLPTVDYHGGSIIYDSVDDKENLLKEALEIVVQHNRAVENDNRTRHENNRALREEEKKLKEAT